MVLDADLVGTGTLEHPAIAGIIKPRQLEARVTLTPPQALDEVVVLEPGQKPPPLTRQEKPLVWKPKGPLGRARIAVDVSCSHKPRMKVGEGWLVLMGGLRLLKEPGGALTYHDRIVLDTGVILIQGRRLEVIKGEADFAGKDRPDPDLSGEAVMRMGKVQIFVSVAGAAASPQLNFTSQPPMSQADILSTLVFGRPAASLNQGESRELSAQALALLGHQGARIVEGIFGSALTPDVVTIHEEAGAGSALEAGKYLSPDLYLRYRQNLESEKGSSVGLEYRITDWLFLESQVGTSRDAGVDATLNFDFGD
jgi:translocation and assembly module TamB